MRPAYLLNGTDLRASLSDLLETHDFTPRVIADLRAMVPGEFMRLPAGNRHLLIEAVELESAERWLREAQEESAELVAQIEALVVAS